MIANDTAKVPGQFWDEVLFDHLQLFWSSLFAAANAAATTRSSDGNEQVFRNFTYPRKMTCVFLCFPSFLFLVAAAAAATTRSSDGNEKFSGTLPLKNNMYFVDRTFAIFAAAAAAATTSSSDGNKKVCRSFTPEKCHVLLLCFVRFLYFWPRPRPRPVQAMVMKKFSGILPLKKIGTFINSHPFLIRGSSYF